MNKYIYDGAVKEFDKVVATNWHAETCAESARKARSNIAFQYKKKHNKSARTRITLPGDLTEAIMY